MAHKAATIAIRALSHEEASGMLTLHAKKHAASITRSHHGNAPSRGKRTM